MDDIFPKLVIALVTASVGFFWLLAYKHPKTFKAVGTPFMFMFGLGLIFSLPFWFAASMISDLVGGNITFNDHYGFIADRDTRAKVSQTIISEMTPFQRVARSKRSEPRQQRVKQTQKRRKAKRKASQMARKSSSK